MTAADRVLVVPLTLGLLILVGIMGRACVTTNRPMRWQIARFLAH